MVSEAPHNQDLFEVDEPTHPFSRVEIDRLRQIADLEPLPAQAEGRGAENPELTDMSARSPLAVVPSLITVSERPSNDGDRDKEEWFELDGRWLRVSLESFSHFGLSGAPPGMVGSVDASFVSGTINGQACAPLHPLPRLTEVYQAPAPEPEPEPAKSSPSSRARKRGLWAVLVASPLVLALAAWVFTRIGVASEQPMDQDAEPVSIEAPDGPTEGPTATVVAPPIPSPEPEAGDDETGDIIFAEDDEKSRKRKPSKDRADSDACVEHRKLATRAEAGGKWAQLEELAQRRKCWPRSSEAKALQMRALFELERFAQCVEMGAQGGPKEIHKWVSNCQRALD